MKKVFEGKFYSKMFVINVIFWWCFVLVLAFLIYNMR